MKHIAAVLGTLVVGAWGTHGGAVEVTGGDLNLKYSTFNEKAAGVRLDTFAVDGAVEIGFNKSFSAQIDLGLYNYGAIGESGHNAVLHGIYHMNENTSFGAFYGRDDISVLDADFYGVEVGHETGDFEIEGYLGFGNEAGVDTNLYGVHGSFGLGEKTDVIAGFEKADTDLGTSFSRVEIGVRYNASPSSAYVASIGSAEGTVGGLSGSETFVSFGAEFTFGAERGATFGRRGLLKLLPGL